ncbi:MAG: hypothetical protein ACRDD8_15330 [Bacteroidales bacterium]
MTDVQINKRILRIQEKILRSFYKKKENRSLPFSEFEKYKANYLETLFSVTGCSTLKEYVILRYKEISDKHISALRKQNQSYIGKCYIEKVLQGDTSKKINVMRVKGISKDLTTPLLDIVKCDISICYNHNKIDDPTYVYNGTKKCKCSEFLASFKINEYRTKIPVADLCKYTEIMKSMYSDILRAYYNQRDLLQDTFKQTEIVNLGKYTQYKIY